MHSLAFCLCPGSVSRRFVEREDSLKLATLRFVDSRSLRKDLLDTCLHSRICCTGQAFKTPQPHTRSWSGPTVRNPSCLGRNQGALLAPLFGSFDVPLGFLLSICSVVVKRLSRLRVGVDTTYPPFASVLEYDKLEFVIGCAEFSRMMEMRACGDLFVRWPMALAIVTT
jgi:hypothetical protein